ncbi:ABC transporter substrate-binding protein [Paenibacillus eucommiae]|uniref:Multiple sugar transport system substrate-binding protein n=1 Tax=Paenibacillus eucommiae TaxID=1355755 RepID=A0ABS4J3X2_9BACL|nr:sugar ABC transporter substrate-binding protein [Paenibacillus eucommiae]MBP1994513.1 multiple sugar transport system substrate-binding protein [Paenibacillus eucommiae]
MKRRFMLVLAVVLVLSLAACGKSENGSPSSSPAGTKAPDASAPPKEMKLKIGLPGAYDVTKKEIIDGFIAKYPNIKTEVVEAPWGDFTTKITTEIAGGTAPDIWFQENAVILGYGSRGIAEDLTPYISKDLKDDEYISGLFAAKASDGKVYGIPHGINPVALAYNKKMFTDANIPVPTDDWTYADMLDAAKKLTKDTNQDGKTDQYGFAASQGITQGWYPWTRSHGGQVLDESKTKAMFTEPKSIEGVQAWADLVKDGISPDADFLKLAGGDWKAFGAGQAAMFFMQYSTQVLINKEFAALDYDTVMMPKGADGTRIVPMVTNSWLIFSKAKPESKEAAWEFLKYYLSEEAQTILAQSGSSIPVQKNAITKLDTNVNPKNKKAFSEGIAEAGVTTDENPSWQEWRLAAQPFYTDMFTQKISVQEGMKEIQQKVQSVLDQNK